MAPAHPPALPMTRLSCAAALLLAACPRVPASAPPSPPLRVLVFGDFGAVNGSRDAVAKQMIAFGPYDMGILAGDNLYECGPDLSLPGADRCEFNADGNTVREGFVPPRDVLFDQLFEKPLAALVTPSGGPLPIWLALGNHDLGPAPGCVKPAELPVTARRKACLEVAYRSERWHLPARHYVHDQGGVRFIVLDGNLIEWGDFSGFHLDDEVAFLREASRPCREKLCFIVSHQGAASAGPHGGEPASAGYGGRVKRLLEAAPGAVAWLAGHDHDLQHLRQGALDAFVSGCTAKEHGSEEFQERPGAGKSLFASAEHGFAILTVEQDRWSVEFVSEEGKPLHRCTARGRGHCEPEAGR